MVRSRARDTDDETGDRDDAIVRAEYAGAQPVEAIVVPGVVLFAVVGDKRIGVGRLGIGGRAGRGRRLIVHMSIESGKTLAYQ